MFYSNTTVALAFTIALVVGSAAAVVIENAMTARVDVACPSPTVPSRDQDLDAALRRFMSPPAPPTSGNPRY